METGRAWGKKIKGITTKEKKRNIEAQKREQRHRQVKGEFAYMATPKRDRKNKCGSYRMGKRRKPEGTADIKSQVRESLRPGVVKKSTSYTKSCGETVIKYEALRCDASLE